MLILYSDLLFIWYQFIMFYKKVNQDFDMIVALIPSLST